MITKSFLVRIGADDSEFQSKLNSSVKSLQRAGKAMTVAGAAIVGSVGLMVKSYVDAGDEVQKMAKRTGFSTEALSELKYAADISGTSISAIEKGVKRMSGTILDASDGLETYVRAFEHMGLRVEELQGLAPEEQFTKIAMAIASLEDPTMRAALAQDVFGRAGTELLPLFDQGSEGMEALRQKAHELGIVFDQEAADKAARLKDAQTSLKAAFKGVGNTIATTLVPTITGLIEKVTDIITKVRAWMEEHPELANLITKVVLVIGGLSAVLGPLLVMLPLLASGFSMLIGPIGIVIAAIAGLIAIGILVATKWEAIKNFFINLWTKIKEIFNTAISLIVNTICFPFIAITVFITQAWDALKGFFSSLWETIKGFFVGAFDAIKEIVTGAWEEISEFFSSFFETVKGIVTDAWEAIKGFFTGGYEALKTGLVNFVEGFLTFFSDFGVKLKDFALGLVNSIVEKFTWMYDKIKEIVNKVKEVTVGIFKKIKEKIVGHSIVPDMVFMVVGKMQDMRSGIKTELEGIRTETETSLEGLRGNTEIVFGNISDYAEAMQSASSSEFKSMGESLKDSVRSMLKTLESQSIAYIIAKVMAALPFPFNLIAVAGAIATVKTLFSALPKFGEGGIAWGPQLAVVGEKGPELILPLSKAGEAGGMGSTFKQNVYFYGNINNAGSMDEISNRLAEKVRRSIEQGRK